MTVAEAPAEDQRRDRGPRAASMVQVGDRRPAADPETHPGADPRADAVGEVTTGRAPTTRRPSSRSQLVTNAAPAARGPTLRRRHEDRRLERCRRPVPTRGPTLSGSDACRSGPKVGSASALTRLCQPEGRHRRPLLPTRERRKAAPTFGSPRRNRSGRLAAETACFPGR
jgi:hypothetical protein